MENEVSQTFSAGNFQFSGANINSLESSEYSLCSLLVDSSASIDGFTKEMENAVKQVVESCQKSSRSDNLMLQVLNFDVNVNEHQGFTELNKCVLSSYDGMLDHLGGATSLYDAIYDGTVSLTKYSEELFKEDYFSNGILFCITDGLENRSSHGLNDVKSALKVASGEGKLESLKGILIGVNTGSSNVSGELSRLAAELNFDYIDVKGADSKSLAKLANFVSRSLSSTSSVLGSGNVAPSLTF